jgi:putative DNA primase/helicase
VTLSAADIHARLGSGWPAVLAQLGIAETALRIKKPGPCPACGGVDRFTFDNRSGRGDFICRGCGAGDGFALLMRVHRWDFRETRQRVLDAAHLGNGAVPTQRPATPPPDAPAMPTRRVRDVRRAACDPADVADVREYLASRAVWPLPPGCTLRAHAGFEYFAGRDRVGRYAALVAEVRDVAGDLVTVHVTYLKGACKIESHEPRKLLSPLTGRTGCAVRLMPLTGDTVGIAEGIESAFSASVLHDGVPTWAALNTSLLAKFEPPEGVQRLVVFADRDVPGLEAAARLMERLQGRVRTEICPPPPPCKDWNDRLKELAA